mgnify:CR=1 FL=1
MKTGFLTVALLWLIGCSLDANEKLLVNVLEKDRDYIAKAFGAPSVQRSMGRGEMVYWEFETMIVQCQLHENRVMRIVFAPRDRQELARLHDRVMGIFSEGLGWKMQRVRVLSDERMVSVRDDGEVTAFVHREAVYVYGRALDW